MQGRLGRVLTLMLFVQAFAVACLDVREDNEIDGGPQGCGNCHLETGTTPAHLAHVGNDGAFGGGYDCSECHPVPGEWFVEGHVDGIVQVEFKEDGLARADGAQPVFDGARCYNVYCHGGTMADAGIPEPAWNSLSGNTPMVCGDCHGIPPAQPHPTVDNCKQCHAVVYDGEALDKAVHINGRVDLGSGSGAAR